MTRLYETECIYCGACAVLNFYCRQCEANQPQPLEGYSSTWHVPNLKVDDATPHNSDSSERSTGNEFNTRQDQTGRAD